MLHQHCRRTNEKKKTYKVYIEREYCASVRTVGV